MRVFSLKHADGSVAIMHLVDGADLNEAVRKFSQSSFIPVEVSPLDPAAIPADRTYRNAWTRGLGGPIVHDMAKAKEIHRDKLRAARKTALLALDTEVSKALARGDAATASAHETDRQRLRDVTADPRIANAQTVEQLKAVWPL